MVIRQNIFYLQSTKCAVTVLLLHHVPLASSHSLWTLVPNDIVKEPRYKGSQVGNHLILLGTLNWTKHGKVENALHNLINGNVTFE